MPRKSMLANKEFNETGVEILQKKSAAKVLIQTWTLLYQYDELWSP